MGNNYSNLSTTVNEGIFTMESKLKRFSVGINSAVTEMISKQPDQGVRKRVSCPEKRKSSLFKPQNRLTIDVLSEFKEFGDDSTQISSSAPRTMRSSLIISGSRSTIDHFTFESHQKSEEKRAAQVICSFAKMYLARQKLFKLKSAKMSYESETQYFSRNERMETLVDSTSIQNFNLKKRVGPIKYRYICSGAIYDGTWLGNFRDGKGTITWEDGTSYTGEWCLGYAHGWGRFVDKIGNIYEGPYYMSMAHGSLGTYTNTYGDMYSGQWKFDKKHGKGIEYWRATNSTYEGEYFEGEREGFGKFSVDDQVIYEGTWKNGKMNGIGKFHLPDGKVYKGHFKNGQIQGFGQLTWPKDGKLYEGEFKDGVREGYGYFHWDHGKRIYQGWWHKDQQHGLGIQIDIISQKKQYGIWSKGHHVLWVTDPDIIEQIQDGSFDYMQEFIQSKILLNTSDKLASEYFIQLEIKRAENIQKQLNKINIESENVKDDDMLFAPALIINFSCPLHIQQQADFLNVSYIDISY